MNLTVGAAVEALNTADDYPDADEAGQVLVIQNNAGSDLFFDFRDDVTTATGVRIAAGGFWEIPRWSPTRTIYLISAGEVDVRYTVEG